MKIAVELRESDWMELLTVASQGYGDGTVYDLDKPAKSRPDDWRKRANAYWRAVNAINRGREMAARSKLSP